MTATVKPINTPSFKLKAGTCKECIRRRVTIDSHNEILANGNSIRSRLSMCSRIPANWRG